MTFLFAFLAQKIPLINGIAASSKSRASMNQSSTKDLSALNANKNKPKENKNGTNNSTNNASSNSASNGSETQSEKYSTSVTNEVIVFETKIRIIDILQVNATHSYFFPFPCFCTCRLYFHQKSVSPCPHCFNELE
jgi:hypothetical protein